MIRRVYTNRLQREGIAAARPEVVELELDGVTLTVAGKRAKHRTAEAARAAFDAAVEERCPRFAMEAPPGEDASLEWIGSGLDSGELEVWVRVDDYERESGGGDRGLSGLLAIANLGFRDGFVDTVHLASPEEDDGGYFFSFALCAERELESFLKLPVAARVRRVVIGPVGEALLDGRPFVTSERLLSAAGTAPSPLQDLVLRGGDYRDLSPIAALASLERLTLDHTQIDLSRTKLASASLRELCVCNEPDLVPELAAKHVKLPKLETLELRAGIVGFEALLGKGGPPFRALAIETDAMEHAVETLAAADCLARLERLSITGFEVAGARRALAKLRARFAHVKVTLAAGGDQ